MKQLIAIFSFFLISGLSKGEKPELSFYCELKENEFVELFADSSLIKDLTEMKVSLRIGLHDFSTGRADVIRRLNKAGIPMYAWLLLPEEDGYWFNMFNGDKAIQRYHDFKEWTTGNNLKWQGIGLDIEPDMNDGKMAVKHPWRFAWKAYKRLYDNKSLKNAKETYHKLITEMKADGYMVESYIIPYLFEERAKKTTSLQKLMGIVDIETDREIPMLYTSLLDNPGIIPLYHKGNSPVALGSTGGGVNIEGIELASLTWDKLERDLLVASRLTNEIVIFCLETTVQKDFLSKIKSIDYNKPVPDISVNLEKSEKINSYLKFLLGVLDHPLLLTIVILLLISGIIFGIYRLIFFLIRLIIKPHFK